MSTTAPPPIPLASTGVEFVELTDDNIAECADLLHAWVTHPRSRFWGLGGATREEVIKAHRSIAADPHHTAWMGSLDGEPAFIAELYDPRHHALASSGAGLAEGDIGMHLLVAPPQNSPAPGRTRRCMAAAVAWALARPGARRVVVEPDVANHRIHVLNALAGFRVHGTVQLPDKTALFSSCTAGQFWESPMAAFLTLPTPDPQPSFTEHLEPATMRRAHRHLVAKAMAEFAHEAIVDPDVVDGRQEIRSDDGRACWRFEATRHPLHHWRVNPASITCERNGKPCPVDAQQFIADIRERTGIPEEFLDTYMEEVAATLASHAWKQTHQQDTASALLEADFQTIEAAMTEGHPGFVANNGRIGFSLADHERWAPETGRTTPLMWLAVRREESHLSLGAGLDEDQLWSEELGDDLRTAFAERLRRRGLGVEDYLWLPAHPWQWKNKIAVTFAPDIARQAIVPLGWAGLYQPQQSIRTFFNVARPHLRYVKTALSIQNMGFLRGLSPAYMRHTPAINDWVHSRLAGDIDLENSGFRLLREVAAIGWTGDVHHRMARTGAPATAHRKMVAALWRESPVPHLRPGQRLATLASLLHRDGDGRSLAAAMIRASGTDTATWVRGFLRAYLRPLVHCLTMHRVAFMPHGENLICLLEDHEVVGCFMKDIGEEVAAHSVHGLPAGVDRIRVDVSPEEAALAIFTDVHDGVLRHLGALLSSEGCCSDPQFWSWVRDCIEEHRDEHPEAHSWVDLLAPRFPHSCLNRLQLRNTHTMVDLADQSSSLMYHGTLRNPAGRRE